MTESKIEALAAGFAETLLTQLVKLEATVPLEMQSTAADSIAAKMEAVMREGLAQFVAVDEIDGIATKIMTSALARIKRARSDLTLTIALEKMKPEGSA